MGSGSYIVRPVRSDVWTERISGTVQRVLVIDPEKRAGGLAASPENGFRRSGPAHFVVEAGASLHLSWIVLPGAADMEIPVTVDITGEGADVGLSGLYLCRGTDAVSFSVHLHHRSGHSRSRQHFRGIVGGGASAVFSGLIEVAPDAEETEAAQVHHSLLLSDSARVETRPQLEIYADAVQCSHGATVGFLNAEEQFYMRSRGIPEAEAKALQLRSFVSPVLQLLPGQQRTSVRLAVERAIREFLK